MFRDKYMSFIKKEMQPPTSYDEPRKIVTRRVEIDMEFSEHDKYLLKHIQSGYDKHCYKNMSNPSMIIMGYDNFRAVVRYMYHVSGMLNFEDFMGSKVVLIQNVAPDYLEFISSNQDKFIEMSKHGRGME